MPRHTGAVLLSKSVGATWPRRCDEKRTLGTALSVRSFLWTGGVAMRGRFEFDHVEPFARLGAADAHNIRLLCRAHNLLHARNCFGAMHLAAKIAARKRSVRPTDGIVWRDE